MPQLSKESSTADTGDIFKEFYSEDSTGKKQAKAGSKKTGKQQTFSPASQEKSKASSFSGEFSPNGKYTVQVSCVKSQGLANSLVSKLKAKGFPAYAAEVQNPTPNLSGTFYRVRIGGFSGLSEAKSFGQNTLATDGFEFWIDKKSNDNVGMEGYGLGSSSAGTNAVGSYQSAPTPSVDQTPVPSSTSQGSSYSTTPSPVSEPAATPSTQGALSTSSTTSSSSSVTPAPAASSSSTTSTGTSSAQSSAAPASSSSAASAPASSSGTAPSSSGSASSSQSAKGSSSSSAAPSNSSAATGAAGTAQPQGSGSSSTTGKDSTAGGGW
jgi:hypothetical protein